MFASWLTFAVLWGTFCAGKSLSACLPPAPALGRVSECRIEWAVRLFAATLQHPRKQSRAPELGNPPHHCIGLISFIIIIVIIILFFFSLPRPPSPFSPCSQDEPSCAAFCSLQAACGNSWQCKHGAISRKLCKNGHLLLGGGVGEKPRRLRGGEKLGAAGEDLGVAPERCGVSQVVAMCALCCCRAGVV